jgi:hypothetical protein
VQCEADHFISCPDWGGWIDVRNMEQVFARADRLLQPSGASDH